MGIFHFPSNFVYWRKVPKHCIFKEKILKYIAENPDGHRQHNLIGKGLTSHGNLKSENFLKNYKEFIDSVVWDTVSELLKELNSLKNTLPVDISESIIRQCWYTVYKTNSNISIHNHEGMGRETHLINNAKFLQTFTVLYIINDENEKNGTTFVQLSSETPSTQLEKTIEFKTSNLKDVGEGTVFIFPSNLNHEVMSIPKGGRVIFSCDVLSRFKFNNGYY